MDKTNPKIDHAAYFMSTINPIHKQYLALRRYFVDGHTAEQVALEYGYAVSTVYSLIRDFKKNITSGENDPFFRELKIGRPKLDQGGEITRLVVAYRKQYLSVPEIKAALDALNINVSERYITDLLTEEGFARLPRRENTVRSNINLEDKTEACSAHKSEPFVLMPDEFS